MDEMVLLRLLSGAPDNFGNPYLRKHKSNSLNVKNETRLLTNVADG